MGKCQNNVKNSSNVFVGDYGTASRIVTTTATTTTVSKTATTMTTLTTTTTTTTTVISKTAREILQLKCIHISLFCCFLENVFI